MVDPHSGLEDCKAEATHASDVLFVARPALVAALQGAPDLLHPLVELVGLESQILHVLCALYAAPGNHPEVALRRARNRNRMEDRGLEFQRRVRAQFLSLAEREGARVAVIDGRGSPAAVHARVLAALPARGWARCARS